MVIIYPFDPTTRFLSPIIEEISQKLFVPKINKALPDDYEGTRQLIHHTSIDNTILFLGHGSSFGLSGGCYIADGRAVLINQQQAAQIFKQKKLLLLSCRSAEFITTFDNTYEVAIGFGNIVTGYEDLGSQKEKKKYRDFRSIDTFRKSVVSLFAKTIIEAYIDGYTFSDVYNSMRMRINKTICNFSLSKEPNDRLAGELMYDLKINMQLFGNKNKVITT